MSLDKTLELPVPPTPPFLVEGLVPADGRIMLISPAKKGKSTLALQLAACIGSGTPFLGREVTPGRVLYIQFDNTFEMWRNLLQRGKDAGLQYENVFTIHPQHVPNMMQFDIRLPEWQAWLIDKLTCDPQLVILDVFRKFHKADENQSDAMTAVNNVLGTLLKGRCALILHHSKKYSEDRDHSRPIAAHIGRGSTVIAADADGVWIIDKGCLEIESRLDEDVKIHLQRTKDGFWVTTGGITPDETAQLAAFLVAHPGVSDRELAKFAEIELFMSRTTLRRRLKSHRAGPA